jgi:hypothetical protein
MGQREAGTRDKDIKKRRSALLSIASFRVVAEVFPRRPMIANFRCLTYRGVRGSVNEPAISFRLTVSPLP